MKASGEAPFADEHTDHGGFGLGNGAAGDTLPSEPDYELPPPLLHTPMRPPPLEDRPTDPSVERDLSAAVLAVSERLKLVEQQAIQDRFDRMERRMRAMSAQQKIDSEKTSRNIDGVCELIRNMNEAQTNARTAEQEALKKYMQQRTFPREMAWILLALLVVFAGGAIASGMSNVSLARSVKQQVQQVRLQQNE